MFNIITLSDNQYTGFIHTQNKPQNFTSVLHGFSTQLLELDFYNQPYNQNSINRSGNVLMVLIEWLNSNNVLLVKSRRYYTKLGERQDISQTGSYVSAVLIEISQSEI